MSITYIAKGTFYNFFENKSEFMYHMMIHERTSAKDKLLSFLNDFGKLTRDSLRDYLKWLSAENPNAMIDSLIGQIVDLLCD